MKLYLSLAVVTFMLFTSTSCKKEDKQPTKTEIISKAWRYSVYTVTSGSTTFDVLGQMSPCDADDVTRFKSDGTYTAEEGPSKCSPSSPQIYDNGTWKFESNETKLNLDGDVFDIIAINANTLQIRQVDNSGGTTSTLNITMVPAN